MSYRQANLYLNLLKRSLSGMIQEDPSISTSWRPLSIYSTETRTNGRDWPQNAHTMIGLARLDNLQYCTETVLRDTILGDFIEAGVWRGGACIFMSGVLKVHNRWDRMVWVADSFQGFPEPARQDDKALAEQPEQHHLSVSLEEVKHNFDLYELLGNQVGFIPGWFRDSLPGPVRQLSVLRLDCDLYDSTMDAITPLYPLLEPGGFCIVDDWNVPMCVKAIADYREENKITEPIMDIDGHSVYWRKDAR
jgi:hypothetical protein